MKKILLFSILLGALFFGGDKNVAFAACSNSSSFPAGVLRTFANGKCDAGYTCSYELVNIPDAIANGESPECGGTTGWCKTVTCTKAAYDVYSADTVSGDPYTLIGTKTTIAADEAISSTWMNTPLIYFSNPSQGNILVTLNSKLNSYLPIPSFNTHNGWNVTGDKQKGIVSLDGKDQKNLFYELAMNSITLNRHGQNFNSKEEITSFLQNSDFFDKLGFSTEQKENSLSYVLQKLNDSKVNNKYYYLTILSDESVADISTLTIEPKPNKLIRNYFAIYPTNVPVKTEGSFVFPQKENLDKNNFTVKETGEFLVPNNMIIFFK